MDTAQLEFVPEDVINKYIRYKLITRPYVDLSYDRFELPIRDQMLTEANVEQQELVCAYTKKCIIDPQFGWAISENFELIAESYPYGRFVLDQFKPTLTTIQTQSKKAIQIKKAVLLWENYTNYYHFLNDFVGRLALLDRMHISRDTPIIVSEELKTSNLFLQYVRICPLFFKRNWIFQGKSDYYEIHNCTYFVQNVNCKYQNFKSLLTELHDEANPAISKKIFIVRRGTKGRGLINSTEIEEIARKYDFEIVDTQELTISDQVKLFTNATHIIGLHGAGLTNMIYCKKKNVKIIEIFPGNFYQATYYWLASEFGHEYHCLRGENTESIQMNVTATSVLFSSNFYLDPDKFNAAIVANE